MKPDLYTKAVFTVIAIMLTVIACNQYAHPAVTAEAQGPFAGVQFAFTGGPHFTAFDTRTGDWWIYDAHLISPGLDAAKGENYNMRLDQHGKVTKLGTPTMPYTDDEGAK